MNWPLILRVRMIITLKYMKYKMKMSFSSKAFKIIKKTMFIGGDVD